MSRNLLSKGKVPPPDSSRKASGHALYVLAKGGPQIVEADIDQIVTNPDQPRRHFDEAELDRLAESIEAYGLQQPIGLQALPDGRWRLAFGERRLRAVIRLGRSTIPGILVSGDLDEIALIENVQRVDLDPFEEAMALDRLRQRHGYSHDALGKVLGRSKSMVTKTLMLLRLPDDAHDRYLVAENRPTFRAMYGVAALSEQEDRDRAWNSLLNDADAEDMVQPAGTDVAGSGGGKVKPASRAGQGSDIASGFSPKVVRNLSRARDALESLQSRPARLVDGDREMLMAIRDAADALLNKAGD